MDGRVVKMIQVVMIDGKDRRVEFDYEKPDSSCGYRGGYTIYEVDGMYWGDVSQKSQQKIIDALEVERVQQNDGRW